MIGEDQIVNGVMQEARLVGEVVDTANLFKTTGTLAGQSATYGKLFPNQPAFVPAQFTLMLGLGAPFLHLHSIHSAVISLCSVKSGQGKSAATAACWACRATRCCRK